MIFFFKVPEEISLPQPSFFFFGHMSYIVWFTPHCFGLRWGGVFTNGPILLDYSLSHLGFEQIFTPLQVARDVAHGYGSSSLWS